jgi:hypothetical protein
VEPERIPHEVDEAAVAYRGLLSGKRVLVVLDNAADADQVTPLLPPAASCLAVVTSRDLLAELAGDAARRLDLDVLSAEDSAALLARILDERRVAAEPAAVGELARLGAYLPLALRVAAANPSAAD